MSPIQAIENMLRYIFVGNLTPIDPIKLLEFKNTAITYTLEIKDNIFSILTWLIVSIVIVYWLYCLISMIVLYTKKIKG